MFKKIAILMVVLSIIGGAAFMFNTAMLKGNMMIPVSDTSSGVSSGISSGLSSGISATSQVDRILLAQCRPPMI